MHPKWRLRFIQIAQVWASFSKDPSTKVGCIIVDEDKNQLSSGYNGFPRGIRDDNRLNERAIKYQITCHAEANAIATAARNGHSLNGSILFTTHFPCTQCCALIIQAGITSVYCIEPTIDFLARWAEQITVSRTMFQEAGVRVQTIWVDSEATA